jgi:hypothetical protein
VNQESSSKTQGKKIKKKKRKKEKKKFLLQNSTPRPAFQEVFCHCSAVVYVCLVGFFWDFPHSAFFQCAAKAQLENLHTGKLDSIYSALLLL